MVGGVGSCNYDVFPEFRQVFHRRVVYLERTPRPDPNRLFAIPGVMLYRCFCCALRAAGRAVDKGKKTLSAHISRNVNESPSLEMHEQTYLLELCTIHYNSPNAFVDTAEDRAFKHALFSLETCSDVAVSGCVTSLTRLDSLLDSQVNNRFPS